MHNSLLHKTTTPCFRCLEPDRPLELQAVSYCPHYEEFITTKHECQPMYIDIEVDNSIPLDYDNYADTD